MVKWSDHGSTTSFIFCTQDITHSVAFILRTRSYLDFLAPINDIVVHTYLLCLMSVPINLVSCCGHWQSLIHYDLINANSTFPDKYLTVTNRSPRQPLEKRSFQFYNESTDKRVSALRFAYRLFWNFFFAIAHRLAMRISIQSVHTSGLLSVMLHIYVYVRERYK